MTFAEWLIEAERLARRDSKYMRRGQALYNSLSVDQPDIANQINDTAADPFYDDNRIEAFTVRVSELWDEMDSEN